MVGRVLYALLARSVPVVSLVGYQDPETKAPRLGVYPRKAAQGKPFPRVTYLLISTQRLRTLGKGRSGLVGARVQMECWDSSDQKAADLAQRVLDALDPHEADGGGFRGRVDAYFVQAIEVEDEDAAWEVPAHGDEQGVAREGLEVVVWYEDKPGSP